MSRELLRQALDALELESTTPGLPTTNAAIDALRAALAEPDMGIPITQPVAWRIYIQRGQDAPILYGTYDSIKPVEAMKTACEGTDLVVSFVPLYTAPTAAVPVWTPEELAAADDWFVGKPGATLPAPPAPAAVPPDLPYAVWRQGFAAVAEWKRAHGIAAGDRP
jgi:hypothetical protein